MSFWFGTTEVADKIDLSNLFLGVLGPTVKKDGPWTNSSFDRMSDPTFSRAVDTSISSSCRRLDGDDDDTSERNSFAPGVSHELFINSNQNWGATAMVLIKE